MKKSDFVWCDLSTFELDKAQHFYHAVFGWSYEDSDDYTFAKKNGQEAAGLFVMQEKFQKMGLPSFWMSYITVEDIETVVSQAKLLNGIIEIPPTDFHGQGKIALIRDPAGAGFTVWEGPDLEGKVDEGEHGRMVWNELYVSDAPLVKDFYESVFGWQLVVDKQSSNQRYNVLNGNGKSIAGIEVMSNEVKGDKEFWAVYFSVDDIASTEFKIKNSGGSVIYKAQTALGDTILASDQQGAVFIVIQN